MHLKRQAVPKNWPTYRKGTKYVVRPASDLNKGIPLLIVLRDILEIVQNRKEAKIAIHYRKILLNNKLVEDERESLSLFDTIKIIPSDKSYRLEMLERGKLTLNEIKKGEENNKIAKIVNKRILKGKKIQLNLYDGRNFVSDIKCNPNDSVLINFNGKKIEKCIPLKENAEVLIFSGKHAGTKGILDKIDKLNKTAEIKISDKKINVLIKQIIAIK